MWRLFLFKEVGMIQDESHIRPETAGFAFVLMSSPLITFAYFLHALGNFHGASVSFSGLKENGLCETLYYGTTHNRCGLLYFPVIVGRGSILRST